MVHHIPKVWKIPSLWCEARRGLQPAAGGVSSRGLDSNLAVRYESHRFSDFSRSWKSDLMSYVWVMYELCMGFVWVMYGLCMDYVCVMNQLPSGIHLKVCMILHGDGSPINSGWTRGQQLIPGLERHSGISTTYTGGFLCFFVRFEFLKIRDPRDEFEHGPNKHK